MLCTCTAATRSCQSLIRFNNWHYSWGTAIVREGACGKAMETETHSHFRRVFVSFLFLSLMVSMARSSNCERVEVSHIKNWIPQTTSAGKFSSLIDPHFWRSPGHWFGVPAGIGTSCASQTTRGANTAQKDTQGSSVISNLSLTITILLTVTKTSLLCAPCASMGIISMVQSAPQTASWSKTSKLP